MDAERSDAQCLFKTRADMTETALQQQSRKERFKMPLQDKTRPDRKRKHRRIISNTGRIFDSVQAFADEYNIATQTAYNIIRRQQNFHRMTFQYMDNADQTEPKQQGTTQNSLAQHETEEHCHD